MIEEKKWYVVLMAMFSVVICSGSMIASASVDVEYVRVMSVAAWLLLLIGTAFAISKRDSALKYKNLLFEAKEQNNEYIDEQNKIIAKQKRAIESLMEERDFLILIIENKDGEQEPN